MATVSYLLALLILTAAPRMADAACVWVLWGFVGAGQWKPVDTYESKSRCLEGQKIVYAGLADDMRSEVSLCLPDTLDPRKPKA